MRISQQTTWVLGKGRVKSINIESVLRGRLTRDYGISVHHGSVAGFRYTLRARLRAWESRCPGNNQCSTHSDCIQTMAATRTATLQ